MSDHANSPAPDGEPATGVQRPDASPTSQEQSDAPANDTQTNNQSGTRIFEVTSAILTSTFGDPSITVEWIAKLIDDLKAFQDTHFGPQNFQNAPANHFAKIPRKLLDDCRDPDVLAGVLRILLEYRQAEAIDLDFDHHRPSLHAQLRIYKHFHTQLRQRGHWQCPNVVLSDEIQNQCQRNELAQIVRKLGGAISHSSDPIRATHCIVPDQADYVRVVDHHPPREGDGPDQTRIHRWGSPDSTDQLVPRPQLCPARGIQHVGDLLLANPNVLVVTDKWLFDSEHFNEWMNEIDYAFDLSVAPTLTKYDCYYHLSNQYARPTKHPSPQRKPTSDRKRPASMSWSDASESHATPSELDALKDAKRIKINEHAIRHVQMLGYAPPNSNEDRPTPLLSDGQKEDSISQQQPQPSHHHPPRTPLDRYSPNLQFPHHATWFSINTIHENEKLALPEFFVQNCLARSTNKTPEIYREYRDFMIHAYQQNPAYYLTFTACRRSLAGDVCSIIRVHDFLEHVGLINYAVDLNAQTTTFPSTPDIRNTAASSSNPPLHHAHKGTPDPSQLASPSPIPHLDPTSPTSGDPSVTASRLSHPIEPTPTDQAASNRRQEETSELDSLNNASCSSCFSNIAASSSSHKPPYYYYQHKQHSTTILCSDCFLRRQFPDNSTPSDFFCHSIAQPSDAWSHRETLRLLEALDLYGDDWSKISEHVGSKSKQSCILHFLNSPIIDQDLPSDDANHAAPSSSVDFQDNLPPSPDLLLSNTCHPIVSLLNFLKESVSPKTTKSSIQSALHTILLLEGLSEQPPPDAAAASVESTPSSADSQCTLSPPHWSKIQASSSAGLAASSIRAHLLFEKEEQEIQRLVYQLIETQSKKLELKMKQFDELKCTLDL